MMPNETTSTPTFPSPPPDPEVAFAEAIAAFDSGTLDSGGVRALSDLSRGRRSALRLSWPQWPVAFRRDLTREMGRLAGGNVDLLFGRAFRVALDDDDAIVRQRAIAGLWEDTGDDLRRRLIDLALVDPSPDVRSEAASGLGRFAELGAEGNLDDGAVAEVRRVLTTLAEDETQPVGVRERAIESLGVFGDPAVSGVISDAFASDDPDQMTAAVVAMGRSRSSSWLESVMLALEADDTELRREAARACGEIGDTVAIVELAKAALDTEHDVRVAALAAIAAIGGKGAARILETAAADETYPDREAAELALAAIVDESMLA